MFVKMRRIRQQMTDADAAAVLERAKTGVLSVIGGNGYPYAVPMNFAYLDGKIYLHCAGVGHKIDAIRECDRVSFLVIDRDDVVPDKLTTAYRSVIVFGRAALITENAPKLSVIRRFALKYSQNMPAIEADIDENLSSMTLIEISPEHITGKEGMEIVKAKSKK